MSVKGTWNITMKTPMGDRAGCVTLNPDGDNLTGQMSGDGKSTDIENGQMKDGRACWSMKVKDPMPIKLSFDLAADGDTLDGTVKFGVFGKAKVTGTRA